MRTTWLLLSGLLLWHGQPGFAQSSSSSRSSQRETVILSRDNSGTTTIELKADGLYLDGEQIATRAELNNRNLSKKIIIEERSTREKDRSYEEYYESRGSGTSGRRALLGVISDSRKRGDGAYIDEVSSNSAAEAAGLREGDIITRVDKRDIYNAEDLTAAIRSYRPGTKVVIEYNRDGKDRQTTATLGESRQGWSRVYEESDDDWRDERRPVPAPPPVTRDFPESGRPRLGVAVEDADGGVRIRSVRAGSAAEMAGLREGDIISYIDGRQTGNVPELQAALNDLDSGAQIRVEIIRNGKRLLRTVTWPRSGSSNDY